MNRARPEEMKIKGIYDARFELNELLYQLLTTKENKLVYIDSGNFNPAVIDKALAAHFSKTDKKTSGYTTRYMARDINDRQVQRYAFDLSGNTNTGWNIPQAQLVYDSLQQEKYCLLNESWTYGPGMEKNDLHGEQLFFVANTEQQVSLSEGELLLVLDIIKNGKSVLYQASALSPGQAHIVFYPDYRFSGNETVKLYYWLNGKGQAKITRQELLVIPGE